MSFSTTRGIDFLQAGPEILRRLLSVNATHRNDTPFRSPDSDHRLPTSYQALYKAVRGLLPVDPARYAVAAGRGRPAATRAPLLYANM